MYQSLQPRFPSFCFVSYGPLDFTTKPLEMIGLIEDREAEKESV
jgi:hypothetical protein